MWENIVGRELRRGARNMFWTFLVLAAIIFIAALVKERYLYNLVSGPAKISAASLEAIKDPGSVRRNYVTVQGEESVESGMQEIERRKNKYSGYVTSERVTAGFAVLFIGKRLLIVKHSGETSEKTLVTGTLEPIPDKVREGVIDAPEAGGQEAGGQEVKAAFLPFMLDASNSTETAYGWGGWTLFVLGIGLLLFSGRQLVVARSRLSDIGTHPDARILEKYGTPRDVAEQIESDFGRMPNAAGIRVSNKWILNPTTYGMTIMALEDLAWAYQKTVQHRTNFVPTGTSYQVIIFDRQGRKIDKSMAEGSVRQVLSEIYERAPWTILGYDKEVERAWMRDRPGFISMLDERKRQAAMARSASEVPPQYPTA